MLHGVNGNVSKGLISNNFKLVNPKSNNFLFLNLGKINNANLVTDITFNIQGKTNDRSRYKKTQYRTT